MIDILTRFQSLRLLLVDDDPKQLEVLSIIFEDFFGAILTASNGEEAMHIYQQKKIDMILSDYVMPIMNGLDLCKEIRKTDKITPIVILSNYCDKEKLLGLIPLNLTSYLVKPITYDDIIETLVKISNNIDVAPTSIYNLTLNQSYNFSTKKLSIDGVEESLTKNEAIVLELFINNQDTLVTLPMLEEALFLEEKTITYKVITNILYRLRKKIGKETLQNTQSLGYILKSNLNKNR